jgi:hypothetical protein
MWIDQALLDIAKKASTVALFTSLGEITNFTTPAAGVVDVPSTVIRFARNHVFVDGNVAPLLDSYPELVGSTYLTYRAMKVGGKLEYRPTTASAVTAETIRKPVPTAYEDTGTPFKVIDIDEIFHDAILDFCIWRGLEKLESKNAKKFMDSYHQKLGSHNETVS